MDFAGTMTKAKKELGIGVSGFFSIKDGEKKKVRIVSDAIAYQSTSTWEGEEKLRTQFLVYVIDREDNGYKPYFMPVSVMGFIAELQESEEYGFPKGSDIPYDITISRKKEGNRTTYAVVADRKNTPITEQEQEVIMSLKPLEQIIDRMKAKQQAEDGLEITKDDLPE